MININDIYDTRWNSACISGNNGHAINSYHLINIYRKFIVTNYEYQECDNKQ